jgi:hypothetical protein
MSERFSARGTTSERCTDTPAERRIRHASYLCAASTTHQTHSDRYLPGGSDSRARRARGMCDSHQIRQTAAISREQKAASLRWDGARLICSVGSGRGSPQQRGPAAVASSVVEITAAVLSASRRQAPC